MNRISPSVKRLKKKVGKKETQTQKRFWIESNQMKSNQFE